jgi:transcriptional regulator with XRE-family HTH domain
LLRIWKLPILYHTSQSITFSQDPQANAGLRQGNQYHDASFIGRVPDNADDRAFASLEIGVDETTITNWERNATVPAIRHIPAILQFLGYNTLQSAESLPERLASVRRGLGLSQRKMAGKLGVDPATLRNWEAGRHQLTGKSVDLIARVLQVR